MIVRKTTVATVVARVAIVPLATVVRRVVGVVRLPMAATSPLKPPLAQPMRPRLP